MQRLMILILLMFSPPGECQIAKMTYPAGDGSAGNFFEISTCECADEGTVQLKAPASYFPYGLTQLQDAKLGERFSDCGSIEVVDEASKKYLVITSTVKPSCGVVYVDNKLQEIEAGGLKLTLVELVLDLQILDKTFQAAASCSCPEPQEGFSHTDQQFVGDYSYPCGSPPCFHANPTWLPTPAEQELAENELTDPTPVFERVAVDGGGDLIRIYKFWNKFSPREKIESDMGTLYIFKVKFSYEENGVTKVQEVFQITPQPARWSTWGEWGDCVLPEFTSGELDGTKTRTRVCENRDLNADWEEKCPGDLLETKTCFGGCRYDKELEGSTPCETHPVHTECCAATAEIRLRKRRSTEEPDCPTGFTYEADANKIGCIDEVDPGFSLIPVLFPSNYLSRDAADSVNAGKIISFKALKTRRYPAELIQKKDTRKVNVRIWVRNNKGACVAIYAWPNSMKINEEISHNYNVNPREITLTFVENDFLLPELELEQLSPIDRCMDLHNYGSDMVLESHEVLFAPGAWPVTKLQYLAVDGDALNHEEKMITLNDEKFWSVDVNIERDFPNDDSWFFDTCPAIAQCPETTGTCPECSSSEAICDPGTFFDFGSNIEIDDRTAYTNHPVCATTSGVLISHYDLNDWARCGDCAADQCNTISYQCRDGTAFPAVHGCPPNGCDKPACTDIPWSQWSSCDKSTCQRERTRDVTLEALYALDCKLPADFQTSETKPCQDSPPTCDWNLGIEISCPADADVLLETCTSCNSNRNAYCKYMSNKEQCYDNCIKHVECTDCCTHFALMESVNQNPPICNTDHQCSAGLLTKHMKSRCNALTTEFHAPIHLALCTTTDTTECNQCPSDLSLYDCVEDTGIETQPCIVDENGNGFKPTKICWLKSNSFPKTGYCEVHAPCEPERCLHSGSKSCCHSDTKSCDLTSQFDRNLCSGTKMCKDRLGNVVYGKKLDCCADLPTCSSAEVDECNPCNYLASEYSCLSPSTKTRCPDFNCQVLANTCPCSPAGICHFDPEAADVEVMRISNTLIHQIGFDLPDIRFQRSIKFFIAGSPSNNGVNADNPSCYKNYEPNTDLPMTFSRAELQECGVELNIEKNKLQSFYAHIFVDKQNYFETVSTHSEFAELNCKSWQADLEDDARAMANYEATRFTDFAEGAVNVQFDLSTSADFSTLLDAEANTATVVVGEFVYARIMGDSPFQIDNCEIIGADDQVFMMLDGACPSHQDWKETFMFEYIKQDDSQKIFKWQSVIFREGEKHQQVTYACSVRPCEAGSCDSCENRRKRSAEDPPNKAPSSNVGMLLDIFATQEERDRVLGVKEMQLAKDVGVTVTAAIMFLTSMVGTLLYFFSDPSFNSRRGFYPVINPWASLQKVFLRRVTQPTPEVAPNENNFIKNADMMLQPDADFVIKCLTPPQAQKPRHEDFEE